MPDQGLQRVFAVAASLQKTARLLELDRDKLLPTHLAKMTAFDALITEPTLVKTTRKLYEDGHFALAIEEGFKHVNNTVKRRSGNTVDGATLMRTTFSPKEPILRLNNLLTQSQKDQQQGYMDIFAGCMTGIRNPRAHEHQYPDNADIALELLVLANHLLRMTNQE